MIEDFDFIHHKPSAPAITSYLKAYFNELAVKELDLHLLHDNLLLSENGMSVTLDLLYKKGNTKRCLGQIKGRLNDQKKEWTLESLGYVKALNASGLLPKDAWGSLFLISECICVGDGVNGWLYGISYCEPDEKMAVMSLFGPTLFEIL